MFPLFFFFLCMGGKEGHPLLSHCISILGMRSGPLMTSETPKWGRVFQGCYLSGFDNSEMTLALLHCYTRVMKIFSRSAG